MDGVCRQHFFNQGLFSIQMIVNGLNVRIYKHAMRLTRRAHMQTPIGDVVNHMSTDADWVAELVFLLGDMIYHT